MPSMCLLKTSGTSDNLMAICSFHWEYLTHRPARSNQLGKTLGWGVWGTGVLGRVFKSVWAASDLIHKSPNLGSRFNFDLSCWCNKTSLCSSAHPGSKAQSHCKKTLCVHLEVSAPCLASSAGCSAPCRIRPLETSYTLFSVLTPACAKEAIGN